MRTPTIIITLLLAILMTSCVYHRWLLPEVKGRVIDAVTGEPIAGAEVLWVTDPQIITKTDKSGYYRLSPIKKWDLYVPLGDPIPNKSQIEARSPGFTPTRIQIFGSSHGKDTQIAEDIILKKI